MSMPTRTWKRDDAQVVVTVNQHDLSLMPSRRSFFAMFRPLAVQTTVLRVLVRAKCQSSNTPDSSPDCAVDVGSFPLCSPTWEACRLSLVKAFPCLPLCSIGAAGIILDVRAASLVLFSSSEGCAAPGRACDPPPSLLSVAKLFVLVNFLYTCQEIFLFQAGAQSELPNSPCSSDWECCRQRS